MTLEIEQARAEDAASASTSADREEA